MGLPSSREEGDRSMDIGVEKPPYILEPVVDPVPAERPETSPEPEREPVPVEPRRERVGR